MKEEILKIINDLTEKDLSDRQALNLEKRLWELTGHPQPLDLIFWPKENYSTEETVDIFLKYKTTGFTGLDN